MNDKRSDRRGMSLEEYRIANGFAPNQMMTHGAFPPRSDMEIMADLRQQLEEMWARSPEWVKKP